LVTVRPHAPLSGLGAKAPRPGASVGSRTSTSCSTSPRCVIVASTSSPSPRARCAARILLAAGPSQDESLSAAWQRLQANRANADESEQAIVQRAVSEANGVIAQAARSLGIARTTLSSRLEVLGIRPRKGDG
jgi:transcriptional regulator with GAF, ATPase, and Fis domain